MSDTPIWDHLALEWKVDPSLGAAGVRALVDGQVLAARAAELGHSVLVSSQEGPREVTQHPLLQNASQAPKKVPSARKKTSGEIFRTGRGPNVSDGEWKSGR